MWCRTEKRRGRRLQNEKVVNDKDEVKNMNSNKEYLI